MAAVDFTLKNKAIRDYFNGSGLYEPSAELMYLHTHPLVRPNFLTEIEGLINDTADFMVMRNMRGTIVDRFTSLTVKLGKLLPIESEDQCKNALPVLRDVYLLCKAINKR